MGQPLAAGSVFCFSERMENLRKKEMLLRIMQLEENLNAALWDARSLRAEVRDLKKKLDDFLEQAEEDAEAAAKAEKAFSDGVSNILNYDYVTARRG